MQPFAASAQLRSKCYPETASDQRANLVQGASEKERSRFAVNSLYMRPHPV